jgi:hypothetical protein
MVTIESMALQKPVVNTNIDGRKIELMWMLWFFSASCRSSNLQIVFHCLQPQLGIEMGKNASIYVQQHFDIEKIVVENIQFYKSILRSDYSIS